MPLLRSGDIGFAPRLAALYAGIFALIGIQLPFFPIWLKGQGLDAHAIGVVLAIPMFVRVVAIPFATRTADHYDTLRGAIVFAGVASVAGYVLVGFAHGLTAIVVAFTLASLAFTPLTPLIDAYAMRSFGARPQGYGPVRLWGSAAFIVGSFAAGFAVDLLPMNDLIWLIVAAMGMTALVAVSLTQLPPVTRPPAEKRKPLLADASFIAVIAGASLIQASHAVYYGFSALQWRSDGLSGITIAGLWALGVLAEIILFAASPRLPAMMTPIMLILAGAAGAALRWTAMALDPPVALLPWLQLLHALSFGATYLGALNFVAGRAGPGHGARAQGYLAIASGAAMGGAMGVSGLLYGLGSALAYGAMMLAAVAGGACAFVAYRLGRHMAH